MKPRTIETLLAIGLIAIGIATSGKSTQVSETVDLSANPSPETYCETDDEALPPGEGC